MVKRNCGCDTLHNNDSVHFNRVRSLHRSWGGTFYWVDDKKEEKRKKSEKALTINRDIKISLKNDFPPNPPRKFGNVNNY